jgi:hypothetical protein
MILIIIMIFHLLLLDNSNVLILNNIQYNTININRTFQIYKYINIIITHYIYIILINSLYRLNINILYLIKITGIIYKFIIKIVYIIITLYIFDCYI